MRIKNKKLVWNVLLHDFNSDKIITYNVFGDEFKENSSAYAKIPFIVFI